MGYDSHLFKMRSMHAHRPRGIGMDREQARSVRHLVFLSLFFHVSGTLGVNRTVKLGKS